MSKTKKKKLTLKIIDGIVVNKCHNLDIETDNIPASYSNRCQERGILMSLTLAFTISDIILWLELGPLGV